MTKIDVYYYSGSGFGGIKLIHILNTNRPVDITCRLPNISTSGCIGRKHTIPISPMFAK